MHAHAGFDVGHILLDSVLDTLKMLPFLLAAYIIIEYLERKQAPAVERILSKGGRFGFVPGALLGVVPQCGFSAMAANFYSSRVISLGTLLAVFIATSDEAIPVMLAQPGSYPTMLVLIGSKLVWALVVGFVVDILLRRVWPKALRGGWGGNTKEVDCHSHEEEHGIFISALKHTASIYTAILAFTFAFGLLVGWLGQKNISDFLAGLGFLQPIAASFLGLVPNCASSVIITQLYLSSSISFGSVFAGLSVNAGVGLVILFRTNRNIKQNLFIMLLMYAFGLLPGLILHMFGV